MPAEKECVLSWRWLREDYTLEYGQQMQKEDILMDPARDTSLISQEEIDKINARLNEMQLARVRDTFGLDQKAFFELITQHPEKLLELTAQGAVVSDTETAQDSDEMEGQTSFFDEKPNPYALKI